MKRTVPLLITAIAGFVLIVSFFLPAIQEWGEVAAVWFDILASIAFILGGGNLLKLHLKAMSDKDSGWGYSAITLVAFLVTLAFGLLKLGSPPQSKVEFYGETFVNFPISSMPEYRVAGSLPERADDEPIPPSVRKQLREENGDLVFQGWMNKDQKKDLLGYKETLEWQCSVEQLFLASQPEGLQKILKYYPDHSALSVEGPLTAEVEEKLNQILPDSEISSQAIKELTARSNHKNTIQTNSIPAGFSVPEKASNQVSQNGETLTATGPLTKKIRDEMVREWSDFPPAFPFTPAEEADLVRQIESLGQPLNEEQRLVLRMFFAAEWNANLLIAAINSAAVPETEEKTACELLDERVTGVNNLELEKPTLEPVFLTPEQEAAVNEFVAQPDRSQEEFKARLSGIGALTAAQETAIDKFIHKLPKQAEELKSLGLKLIAVGPLTEEQREFLFKPAAELYAWETEVNKLFYASHQVKYAWSGDYSAQGNPFWWVYEYVLQPLMTTTFAVLAFYVASAAFRAFRAKNLEATLLLGTAFIVLLGRTYLGVQLTAWVPDALSAFKIDQMIVYIMKIFNTAGNRAIMIGIALGIASTSLKVLLGIDRSYLGSGDD